MDYLQYDLTANDDERVAFSRNNHGRIVTMGFRDQSGNIAIVQANRHDLRFLIKEMQRHLDDIEL